MNQIHVLESGSSDKDQRLLDTDSRNINESNRSFGNPLTYTDKEVEKVKDEVSKPAIKQIQQQIKEQIYNKDLKSFIVGSPLPRFQPNYKPTQKDLLNLEQSLSQSNASTAGSRYQTPEEPQIGQQGNEKAEILNINRFLSADNDIETKYQRQKFMQKKG